MGPSFTSDTSMCAPNTPVPTSTPRPRSAATTARDERLRNRPGRRGVPRWPAALARVRVQRELRHHDHGRANIRHRQLAVEDAQVRDLACDELGVGRDRVAVRHANERNDALAVE